MLILMDTLLIGLWVALDPIERHLYNLPMVVDSLDRRVVYQPQVYAYDIAKLPQSFTSPFRRPGGGMPFQSIRDLGRHLVL